jgi:hypothetical protein
MAAVFLVQAMLLLLLHATAQSPLQHFQRRAAQLTQSDAVWSIALIIIIDCSKFTLHTYNSVQVLCDVAHPACDYYSCSSLLLQKAVLP